MSLKRWCKAKEICIMWENPWHGKKRATKIFFNSNNFEQVLNSSLAIVCCYQRTLFICFTSARANVLFHFLCIKPFFVRWRKRLLTRCSRNNCMRLFKNGRERKRTQKNKIGTQLKYYFGRR